MVIKLFGKERELTKATLFMLAAALIAFVVAANVLLGGNSPKPAQLVIKKASSPSAAPGLNVSTSENKIEIYICGAVKHPGVYSVTQGCIVKDAIRVAGGATDEALLDFNLAWQIDQNLMLRIPGKNDKEKMPVVTYEVDYSGGKSIDGPIENSSGQINGGKKLIVNINTANATTLMELPGVGQSTANKIIEYRKTGKFMKLEDIMNVSGIGEKKFADIKEFIIV